MAPRNHPWSLAIRMDYSKVVSVLDYLSKTVQMLPVGEGDGTAADVESD